MSLQINREQAYELLLEFNQNEALIKHALAVEGVMRHFAVVLHEDVEKWGVIGLLHDLDYEKYPEEHCKKAEEIMKEKGIHEDYIHAVVSHGYGICCDVEPIHVMEKVLFTIDELTGLINATALMRPSKSVMDLEYKSLNKKYKTANFAAGVNREVIEKGVGMLQKDLPHITLQTVMVESILGMREVAEAIGLKG